MSAASTAKRTAVAAAAAAAVFLPAAAASAQGAEIPEEGWEYSEKWDFVQDEFTAQAHADTEDLLAEHFEDRTFSIGHESIRLQNYYIDGDNETPVQRKFRADFYVDGSGEGLETALYLPGGITPGIQDLTDGGDHDGHYLLHCSESDTKCKEKELRDGTVVAYTTDGTYIEAAAFFPDGSVGWTWWGEGEGGELPSAKEITNFVADFDTAPVWHALEND
ncbi:hypothetical protein GCM10009830_35250 [Glycomyces endophyticus]|uniref:Uncharacterized protein n=1 Tax=Glycomyces endophyticus TaxID=480996 RepID=A0ABP4TAC6_9ACTN